MSRIGTAAAILAVLLATALPAYAQTNVPNPLRAKPAEQRAETPKARGSRSDDKSSSEKAEPEKPKRERSAKQKENDDIMRACGATWRAEKASLQSKGETWRSFLKDCRAKRKGEVKA